MGLDSVEFIVRVEETFGIRIEDADAAQIQTLEQLERHVNLKLQDEGRPDAQVFDALSRVLTQEFGVASSRIHRGARIARDLGLD